MTERGKQNCSNRIKQQSSNSNISITRERGMALCHERAPLVIREGFMLSMEADWFFYSFIKKNAMIC